MPVIRNASRPGDFSALASQQPAQRRALGGYPAPQMCDFYEEVRLFLARHKMAVTAFGQLVGSPLIIERLEGGTVLQRPTIARARLHMAEHDTAALRQSRSAKIWGKPA